MDTRRSRPARIRSSHQNPLSARTPLRRSLPRKHRCHPRQLRPASSRLLHGDAEHPRQALPAPRLLPSSVENCLNIWRLEPCPSALRPPLAARVAPPRSLPLSHTARRDLAQPSPTRPTTPVVALDRLEQFGSIWTAIVSAPRASPACLHTATLADGRLYGSQDRCDETTTPL
jgi:hypothetical protein